MNQSSFFMLLNEGYGGMEPGLQSALLLYNDTPNNLPLF
jgi:hypothetical protein